MQRAALRFGVPLAAALALLLVAAAREGWRPRPAPGPPPLTLVSVTGLSWDRVTPLSRAGRLPGLAALTARGCVTGDIVAKNVPTRAAILASSVTGRWPGREGVAIWQLLAQARQPSVVVGFPPLSAREHPDNLVLAPERLQRAPLPPGLAAHVTGAREIPVQLRALLEQSLAGDLGAIEAARAALAAGSRRHLFLHLAGLGHWEAALRTAFPGGGRAALSEGYYEVLDGFLADLLRQRSQAGAVLLISDEGNLDGRPSQLRDLPLLERYPAYGFLWATGPETRRCVTPVTLQPPDVAATLLYLAGVPLPTTFDGRIAFGLIEENFYFTHPLAFR